MRWGQKTVEIIGGQTRWRVVVASFLALGQFQVALFDDHGAQIRVVISDVGVVFAQKASSSDHRVDDDADEEAAEEHANAVQ